MDDDKFCTKLNKKAHLRAKRHCCYLAFASQQTALPHVSVHQVSGEAQSIKPVAAILQSCKFFFCLKIKTPLKGCHFDSIEAI